MNRNAEHGTRFPGIDLHLHTTRSTGDSTLTAVRLVERAQETGLIQVAVTNHGTINGAEEVLEIAKERNTGLAVIPAEEIKTSENIELLGYFLKVTIPSGFSLRETIREIKNQEGLLGIPHPFESRRWGVCERAGEVLQMAKELSFEVVLWEIFNANSSPENNRKALSFFFNNQHGNDQQPPLLLIVGSDAHSARQVGNARLLWIPSSPTKEDLIYNLTRRVNQGGTWYSGNDNPLRSRTDRALNRVDLVVQKAKSWMVR